MSHSGTSCKVNKHGYVKSIKSCLLAFMLVACTNQQVTEEPTFYPEEIEPDVKISEPDFSEQEELRPETENMPTQEMDIDIEKPPTDGAFMEKQYSTEDHSEPAQKSESESETQLTTKTENNKKPEPSAADDAFLKEQHSTLSPPKSDNSEQNQQQADATSQNTATNERSKKPKASTPNKTSIREPSSTSANSEQDRQQVEAIMQGAESDDSEVLKTNDGRHNEQKVEAKVQATTSTEENKESGSPASDDDFMNEQHSTRSITAHDEQPPSSISVHKEGDHASGGKVLEPENEEHSAGGSGQHVENTTGVTSNGNTDHHDSTGGGGHVNLIGNSDHTHEHVQPKPKSRHWNMQRPVKSKDEE